MKALALLRSSTLEHSLFLCSVWKIENPLSFYVRHGGRTLRNNAECSKQQHHQVWISRVAKKVKEVQAGFPLGLGVGIKDAPPLCVVNDLVFA